MNIKLWLSANDCGDGSFSIRLHNTKKESLQSLDKESEDEIDNFYDDGMIDEVAFDFDDEMKLKQPFYINIP